MQSLPPPAAQLTAHGPPAARRPPTARGRPSVSGISLRCSRVFAVVASTSLQRSPGRVKALEPARVEALVPQAPVEGLDVRASYGPPQPDEVDPASPRVRPGVAVVARELRPVVHLDDVGPAVGVHQARATAPFSGCARRKSSSVASATGFPLVSELSSQKRAGVARGRSDGWALSEGGCWGWRSAAPRGTRRRASAANCHDGRCRQRSHWARSASCRAAASAGSRACVECVPREDRECTPR